MGRSSFSPPTKKQRLHDLYSWQGKVGWNIPNPINDMHNTSPPTDYLLNKVDV